MAIIIGQAARGVRSHFNTDTPFDAGLFSVMGATIVVLWLATLAVALRFLREPGRDRAAGTAVRLGLFVALLGLLEGFVMVALNGHSVGVADGGPGLPLVGWSTTGGDLRIAHFVGMHALQGLPLLAAALTVTRRLDEHTRVRIVQVAAAAWTGLIVLLTGTGAAGPAAVRPRRPDAGRRRGARRRHGRGSRRRARPPDRPARRPDAAGRYAGGPAPAPSAPSPADSGSRATTRSPPPSGRSRHSVPPASSSVRAAIARPSPEPSTLLCVGLRQNRSVARSSSSGADARAGVADRDLDGAVARARCAR